MTSEERAGLVAANARLGDVLDQGWDAVHDYLAELGRRLVSEGTAAVVADATFADRERRATANSAGEIANRTEALRHGVAGWTDETLALTVPWDFAPEDVTVSLDWWHGSEDNTVPLTAVRRFVARLATCRLHVIDGTGHLVDGVPNLAELARSE